MLLGSVWNGDAQISKQSTRQVLDGCSSCLLNHPLVVESRSQDGRQIFGRNGLGANDGEPRGGNSITHLRSSKRHLAYGASGRNQYISRSQPGRFWQSGVGQK
jgi:hypothetical protein